MQKRGAEQMRDIFKKISFKSILHKMYASFMSIILFIIVIITLSLASSWYTNNTANEIIQERLPEILLIEDLNLNFNRRIQVAYEYIVTGNESRADDFSRLTDESTVLEAELLAINDSSEVKEVILAGTDWSREAAEKVLTQVAEGNDLIASGNLNNLKPKTDAIVLAYEEMIAAIEEDVVGHGEELTRIQTLSVISIIVLGIIAIALSFIIARNTTNSITRPIRQVKERLEGISNSDFSADPMAIDTEDELGDLAQALNVTQVFLIDLIQNVQNVSNTLKLSSNELFTTGQEVQDGAHQITATMQELASGSEVQANSANSLATEMDSFTHTTKETLDYGEEISVSSKHIVEQAQSGNNLMSKTNQQMGTINKVVQQAVEQMNQLNQQTNEISNLVDIINRIAKQTNLLALNASIEAARAG